MNADFFAAYNLVDDKPFGSGYNGEVWKVTKKDDLTETIYVAKISNQTRDQKYFKNEIQMMKLVGNTPGFSNMIDTFEEDE